MADIENAAQEPPKGPPSDTVADIVDPTNGHDATGKTDKTDKGDDLPPPDASVASAELLLPIGEIDPVYAAKARVLNQAVQAIGMGRYQWQLFAVVGFGWASDNLWPIVTSLIFTPVTNEFQPARPPLLTLAQNLGLLAGAVFWGFGCDIFGRRFAFNATLGLAAVWGMIAAGSPNFAAVGVFDAFWSFGVGGNLPVDSAIFLEFLPASHQYLLTILSVDWALAQVVANLIAWPLLGNLTCQEDVAAAGQCTRAANMGWRYFVITMGGLTLIMFAIRFLCFTIYESPKYLMGRGLDAEAVQIVHEVARRNGTTSDLTLADLQACEPAGYVHPAAGAGAGASSDASAANAGRGSSARANAATAIRRKLAEVDADRIKTLFATRRLALSTGLIMAVWALIGLAYPLYNAFLPYIQATRGAHFGDGSTYLTYRNSLIVAVLGVPGALIGGWLVELPRFGRKGTLALSTAVTGVFLYGSTTALTSNALLGWNAAFSFASSVMYAVLYSFTPELFPTPQRGTGNALAATCNRIFGIMAPIIAMFANLQTSAPVYTSGALFLAAGVLVLLLPFESRGKQAL
ncbi:major facilitator superfamily protein [Sporothrix schenckii 1099-18]|uniref:Major facilitator superfamily protein n=1 Tax=Sporothrix schenckii 1099-18 TaxID=1397361 RepID=A0A0F2MGB9_SPOSC|nr:major facilitator superfamily protein [Sporothrix schenckii 1099-18]KJR87211.1 major facilitator superfamily protein [Sporothrix schenckii 1099-18]